MYAENNPWDHASVQDSDLLDIQLASTAPDIPALLEAIQGAREHFKADEPAEDKLKNLREDVDTAYHQADELKLGATHIIDRVNELVGQLPQDDANVMDLAARLLRLVREQESDLTHLTKDLRDATED